MNNQGFTLFLVPVILLFVGLFLAETLQKAEVKTFYEEVQTQSTMERVEKVLAAYAHRNNRVPCPADPSVAPGTASFGQEENGGTRAAPCLVQEGIVPFRTLGLTESDIKDEWGNYLTYAISQAFAREPEFKFASYPAGGEPADLLPIGYESGDEADIGSYQALVSAFVHEHCRQTGTWVDTISEHAAASGTGTANFALESAKDINRNLFKAQFCCASYIDGTASGGPSKKAKVSFRTDNPPVSPDYMDPANPYYYGNYGTDSMSQEDRIDLAWSDYALDQEAHDKAAEFVAAIDDADSTMMGINFESVPGDETKLASQLVTGTSDADVGFVGYKSDAPNPQLLGSSGAEGEGIGISYSDTGNYKFHSRYKDIPVGTWIPPRDTIENLSVVFRDKNARDVIFNLADVGPNNDNHPFYFSLELFHKDEPNTPIVVHDAAILEDRNDDFNANVEIRVDELAAEIKIAKGLAVDEDLPEGFLSEVGIGTVVFHSGFMKPYEKYDSVAHGTGAAALYVFDLTNPADKTGIADYNQDGVWDPLGADTGPSWILSGMEYNIADLTATSTGPLGNDLIVRGDDGNAVLPERGTGAFGAVSNPHDVSVDGPVDGNVEAPAFTLISHGQNGAGAFIIGTTGRLPTDIAGTNELLNTDGDREYHDRRRVISGDANHFDDIIVWGSQFGLYNTLSNGTCETAL